MKMLPYVDHRLTPRIRKDIRCQSKKYCFNSIDFLKATPNVQGWKWIAANWSSCTDRKVKKPCHKPDVWPAKLHIDRLVNKSQTSNLNLSQSFLCIASRSSREKSTLDISVYGEFELYINSSCFKPYIERRGLFRTRLSIEISSVILKFSELWHIKWSLSLENHQAQESDLLL